MQLINGGDLSKAIASKLSQLFSAIVQIAPMSPMKSEMMTMIADAIEEDKKQGGFNVHGVLM